MGQGTPGVSIVDVTECAVNWVQVLYDSGARNFLFQNVSLLRSIRETKETKLTHVADGALARHTPLLCRLLAQSVLDGGAKHDRMECPHGRDGEEWQRIVKSTPPNPYTNTEGCTRR